MRSAPFTCMAAVLGFMLLLGTQAPSAYAQSFRQIAPAAAASAAACPVPPVNFDILHASLAQLHYYGLPLPPQSSATERANWAKGFPRLTSRFCGMGKPVPTAPDHLDRSAVSFNSYQQSLNWSGYYTTNGGFTLVKGKWWVPTYCCSPSNSTAVQWVGIGGVFGNQYLFQAGTETDPVENYRFWWEAAPNPVHYQGPAVSPGNEVYVEVDYNRTCGGQSYAFMYNYATGGYWGTPCQSFTPDQGSADWIVERGSVWCGSYYGPTTLAQTTQVNWHSDFADSTNAGGNTDHNIGYYNNTEVDMVDNGYFLESTSVLGTGGDGGSTFNSTFDNNNGTYCG